MQVRVMVMKWLGGVDVGGGREAWDWRGEERRGEDRRRRGEKEARERERCFDALTFYCLPLIGPEDEGRGGGTNN